MALRDQGGRQVTVAELIAILQRVDPTLTVDVAYDSFAVTSTLEPEHIYTGDGGGGEDEGVIHESSPTLYLCATSAHPDHEPTAKEYQLKAVK